MTAPATSNIDLTDAITQLEESLRRAADAASKIRAALPRIERLHAAFSDLETIIEAGRRHSVDDDESPRASRSASLTAVAPERPASPPKRGRTPASDAPAARNGHAAVAVIEPEVETPAATTPIAGPLTIAEPLTIVPEAPAIPKADERLVSFRLEFESNPGPLDLRAVDDAVGEHPAVRDVALLDYDGRRATLKVWIAPPASPADVQQSLTARAGRIGPAGNDVSIIALEDVA